MGWKSNLVAGAAVLGMVVGANEMFMPRTPEQTDQYRREQLIEQGSDALERENQQLRDQLPGEIDAENSRARTPGEYWPPEPKRPSFRLRP